MDMSECYLAFTETPLRPNFSAQHIYAKGLYLNYPSSNKMFEVDFCTVKNE